MNILVLGAERFAVENTLRNHDISDSEVRILHLNYQKRYTKY